ncbi:MAG: hypothetical protein ACFFAU_16870 [Candidatus Hodarchaeota archaeon]
MLKLFFIPFDIAIPPRFSVIQLETNAFMHSAPLIYRSHGFKEIEAFPGAESPEPIRRYSLFMEKTWDTI